MVVYICKFQSPNLCPLPPSCVIHLFSISASLFLSWNRFICMILLLPGSSAGKESACNAGDPGLIPRVRKIPWRRDRVPTPVFRPREFNGQRSLAGYSPKTVGVAESDTIEWISLSLPPAAYSLGFLGGSDNKESAFNAGDAVWSLGGEDPLEKEKATHSSILAWRITWTEEPGRLQSMG